MKSIVVKEQPLAVFDEGDGPPLLLVHGFPLDHSMWKPVFPALVGPYRVIAPDLPGFGASEPPVHPLHSMSDYARLLLDLLDELHVEEPVSLIGLSMGGYIGWSFWQQAGGRLRSLIQCDTRAVADDSETSSRRFELAEHVLEHGAAELPAILLPRILAPSSQPSHEELVDQVIRMITGASREGIATASRAMANRPDWTGRLARMDLPALLLCGAYDSISPPSEMRAMAAALPNADYREIPDAGHLAPMENPVVVGEIIARFLERH